MCTRPELVKKRELDIGDVEEKVILAVISQMKKFVKKGYEVTFAPMGMGEPLMNKNMSKIIKLVKTKVPKAKVVLVSNGIMLDELASKSLIKSGVDELSISLNVNNAKNYIKYIGNNNYDRVVSNIKKFLELRNELGANNPKLYIQYLGYKGEKNDFDKDIDVWNKLFAPGDKCYVHPIVNQAGYKKEGVTLKKSEDFPCTSVIERVTIRINGDMYPCDPCFYAGKKQIPELHLGNILDDDYFKMYFDKSSKIWSIVKSMKAGDYSNLPTCKRCNTYKLGVNSHFKIFGKWW